MVDKIQEELKKKKGLIMYNKEELEYLKNPIGYSIYTSKEEKHNNDKKKHWSDILICPICKGTYKRSHKSLHMKTQKHKIYEECNMKLIDIFLKS